jgi:hypothetical protein
MSDSTYGIDPATQSANEDWLHRTWDIYDYQTGEKVDTLAGLSGLAASPEDVARLVLTPPSLYNAPPKLIAEARALLGDKAPPPPRKPWDPDPTGPIWGSPRSAPVGGDTDHPAPHGDETAALHTAPSDSSTPCGTSTDETTE